MSRQDYSHKFREQTGMACPRCGCRKLKSSRATPVGDRTRRTRICRGCGLHIKTEERVLPELVGDTNFSPESAKNSSECDSLPVLDLVE